MRVWNLGNQLDFHITSVPADGMDSIDISSDGKYLLLSDDASKNELRPTWFYGISSKERWSVLTLVSMELPPLVQSHISPDDQYIAIAGSVQDTPTVMIWYLESGDVKCRFTTYDAFGRAVAFSPDSHYLLAGSQDPTAQTGQLILWDVQNLQAGAPI